MTCWAYAPLGQDVRGTFYFALLSCLSSFLPLDSSSRERNLFQSSPTRLLRSPDDESPSSIQSSLFALPPLSLRPVNHPSLFQSRSRDIITSPLLLLWQILTLHSSSVFFCLHTIIGNTIKQILHQNSNILSSMTVTTPTLRVSPNMSNTIGRPVDVTLDQKLDHRPKIVNINWSLKH